MPDPIEVRKVPIESVTDASGLARLIDDGVIEAHRVLAVVGKTEGNGGVNDYTRILADRAFREVLAANKRVVASRQLEVAHVGDHEAAGRVLPRGNPHERRLDVDTIDGESPIGEQPRVLARAAANVEHRAAIRIETTQQGADGIDLRRVVLERGVNKVVVLR